jgi:hypothetical protein
MMILMIMRMIMYSAARLVTWLNYEADRDAAAAETMIMAATAWDSPSPPGRVPPARRGWPDIS